VEHWESSLRTQIRFIEAVIPCGTCLVPSLRNPNLVDSVFYSRRDAPVEWKDTGNISIISSVAYMLRFFVSVMTFKSPSPCTQRTYQAVGYTRNLRRLLFHISQLEISKNPFLQPKLQAPRSKDLPIKRFNSQMSLSLYTNMPVVS
jgi:hypothetical protein